MPCPIGSTCLCLVDSGGYPFVSSSVPIGFRIAQIPVVNHFLEYVTPRSLVAASVRNVYCDPSKVTPALVDRYFDMTVRAGNRHALVQRFLQSDFGAEASQNRRAEATDAYIVGKP